jgi:hypothetical protein
VDLHAKYKHFESADFSKAEKFERRLVMVMTTVTDIVTLIVIVMIAMTEGVMMQLVVE